jgi:uncharacterized protein YgiM (DUF1202 family)
MKKKILSVAFMLLIGACSAGNPLEQVPPTATLAPIVSLTPRSTATPVPSRTPSPTLTFTVTNTVIPPTATTTPSPTATPPVIGVVASLQSVNVREGPGTTFSIIEALQPGTGIEILGPSEDQRWYNILMPDGEEGWISADLVRLQPSATPAPSLTPSPDLTALALGTPLPTALFGGGTITPTPPRSVVTPTLPSAETAEVTAEAGLQLPNIESINQTATALVGGVNAAATAGATQSSAGGRDATSAPGANTAAPSGEASVQTGVDVSALCDDPSEESAPTNLAAGSTIDISWYWYAQTIEQVQDHLNAVNYEVRLDGNLIANWRAYTGEIEQRGNLYYVFWYARSQPLDAGEHQITYRVSWSQLISDGFDQFGPGTRNPVQTGSCTFTVR